MIITPLCRGTSVSSADLALYRWDGYGTFTWYESFMIECFANIYASIYWCLACKPDRQIDWYSAFPSLTPTFTLYSQESGMLKVIPIQPRSRRLARSTEKSLSFHRIIGHCRATIPSILLCTNVLSRHVQL